MNRLDPLERMREMDRKLDTLSELADDCSRILRESNEKPPSTAESFEYIQTLAEANRPLPMRRGGSGLLMWLLVFVTFAFLSGAVFQASRGSAQSPAANVCILSLTENINTALMSRQTARRKARAICYDIRYSDRDFYKALTQ